MYARVYTLAFILPPARYELPTHLLFGLLLILVYSRSAFRRWRVRQHPSLMTVLIQRLKERNEQKETDTVLDNSSNR